MQIHPSLTEWLRSGGCGIYLLSSRPSAREPRKNSRENKSESSSSFLPWQHEQLILSALRDCHFVVVFPARHPITAYALACPHATRPWSFMRYTMTTCAAPALPSPPLPSRLVFQVTASRLLSWLQFYN